MDPTDANMVKSPSSMIPERTNTTMNEPLSPRSAIHAELEATRSAFHHLLTVIPDSIWQQKEIHSAWTIKEEMWHIAWGMRFILDLIKNARRGVGLPKPPMFIADRLNVIYSRLRSARATRRSIARRYDTTHAVALSLLEIIRDDEWEISVVVFGQAQTVEELFYGIPQHFEEHAARIRPRLDEM